MILGILSDTHDQVDRTHRAVRLLREAGAEALVHCGDFTRPAMLELCALWPCWFVFGNNDDDRLADWQQIATDVGAVCLAWGGELTLAGKRIAVTHGHVPAHVRRLHAARPDYLCVGHSHVAADHRTGATRQINPGALYRARHYSVAVLDLTTDELQFLDVPR